MGANGRPSLRSRWRRALYATRGISPPVVLTMLAYEQDMQEDGTVSVPVTTIMARRSLSRSSIKAHVKAAIEAGAFDRVARGYDGHTAVYKAVLPAPRAARQSGPSETAREGPESPTPLDPRNLAPLKSDSSTFNGREGPDSLPTSTSPTATGTVTASSGEDAPEERQERAVTKEDDPVPHPLRVAEAVVLAAEVKITASAVVVSTGRTDAAHNDDVNLLRRCSTCTGYVLHGGGDRCASCLVAERPRKRDWFPAGKWER